jgi:putative ABC transport system ATP-binding protein
LEKIFRFFFSKSLKKLLLLSLAEDEMDFSEEELQKLYATMSHPARRRILHFLNKKRRASFTDLMNELGVSETGNLSYHLVQMQPLVAQDEKKRYYLSALGKLAISVERKIIGELEVKRSRTKMMKTKNAIVVLKDVVKDYGSGENIVRALDGINLAIEKEEFWAILGPSGSGKSTLLNVISGIDKPTKGEVYVNGQHLTKMSETNLALFRRKNVGYIFQFFNLVPILTTLENVMVPMDLLGLPSREAEVRSKALLREVGLEKRTHHYPSQLSGGELQRTAIARALANSPPLVLCDEPTGNLDTETGAEIVGLLKRINEKSGATFIIVTHDERITAEATRVLHILDGKIK